MSYKIRFNTYWGEYYSDEVRDTIPRMGDNILVKGNELVVLDVQTEFIMVGHPLYLVELGIKNRLSSDYLVESCWKLSNWFH